MNHLDIDGYKITYAIENAGQSKTVFFIHGNSQSYQTWRKQLSSPYFREYRLIAFNLPAHDTSALPPAELCTLPALAGLLVKAVEQLSNHQPFCLAGVSLGTNIIAEMLAHPIQPVGIILAGPCIVADESSLQKMIKPGTAVHVVFSDEAPEPEVRQYALQTSLSQEVRDVDFFLEDYAKVKKPFRSLLGKSIAGNQFSNEIKLIQEANIPLLLVFGKDEKIIDPDYLDNTVLPLWRNTIFKLPGASHLLHIDQPDAFNNLLKEYLAGRFK